MNILLTLEKGITRNIYFPSDIMSKIESLGNLTCNESLRPLTEDELKKYIKDVEICITHWGCSSFTEEVLCTAGRLKLIAHAAGSVASIVTEDVYKRGIKVCSANDLMARYVAEGVLAYMLGSLRAIPQHDHDMKNSVLWNRRIMESRSLINAKLGLVGLGAVGRYLLGLLAPFDIGIKLYDPYVSRSIVDKYSFVELCSLDKVLSWGDIISVHASLTQETYHMLNASRLKLVKNNALLVNTARGAVFDQTALEEELSTGRFNAVLDVFEEEPLPLWSRLRQMDNVILLPHMAAKPAREQMSQAIIEEIERFKDGKQLRNEIYFDKYKLMTDERVKNI